MFLKIELLLFPNVYDNLFSNIVICILLLTKIYTSKKVTHNILVYRQVQIIVAVTCVLYISYVIEYKEKNFESFR